MAEQLVRAYAQIVHARGAAWYRIFFHNPGESIATLRGPYRDTTDAENAAHDEANIHGYDLEWAY